MSVADLTVGSTEASEPSPATVRRQRARRWYLALLVGLPMAAAAAVYANALHNPFVWDDFRTVADNPSLVYLGDVRRIVLQDRSRPMVNLSYAVDQALWGPQPFGFHFGSVFLHVLNVALLFLVIRRLIEDWQAWRPGLSPPPPEIVAAAAVWLFAVHPVMTEAVGYISGRADVLCATFVLLALLALRRWAGGGSSRWLAIGVVCWLYAMGSKETAAVFPLLLLAYRSTVVDPDDRRLRARLLRVGLGLTAGAVVAGVIRLAVLFLIENPGGTHIYWWHLVVEADVVRQYLELLILPSEQSVMHPTVSIAHWSQVRASVALGFLALLVAMAVWCRRRAGPVSFGLTWFLLALAPPGVLVVFDLAHPMAEHRAYQANGGLFLCVGFIVGWLLMRPHTTASARRLLMIVLGFGVVTFGAITVVRNAVWSDPRILWLDAVRKAPDVWLPHLLLGESLHAAGQREAALAAYTEARRLRPDYPDISLKLGLCLIELGRLDSARQVFEETRVEAPWSPLGPQGLGTVALLEGDPESARRHFVEALARDPRSAAARESLALLDDPAEPAAAAVRPGLSGTR